MVYQVGLYSEAETVSIQVVETIMSFLSIAACTYSLRLIYSKHDLSPFDKLISVIIIIQFMLSLLRGIGLSAGLNKNSCNFQGFFISWFSAAQTLWMMIVSWQLYSTIINKRNPLRIKKDFKRYVIACVLLATVVSIIVLIRNKFAVSYAWCWNKAKSKDFIFYMYYSLMIAVWFTLTAVLMRTSLTLRNLLVFIVPSYPRQSSRQSLNAFLRHSESEFGFDTEILEKLRQYLFVFLFMWFFTLLARTVEIIQGHCFATSFLVAFFVPLEGFCNAFIYTDGFSYLSPAKQLLRNNTSSSKRTKSDVSKLQRQRTIRMTGTNIDTTMHELYTPDSLNSNTDITSNPMLHVNSPIAFESAVQKKLLNTRGSMTYIDSDVGADVTVKSIPKSYSIFNSTFNCGECKIEDIKDDLFQWILPGHDIYAIGLQECICLSQLREAISAHLGPHSFKMFTTEIGSSNTSLGFHGFIALTVYIKTAEIQKGKIKFHESATSKMATGKNLLITTAENKGAVGLQFQIYDSNVVFVSCHLPSDTKGISKLEKRNSSSNSILRDMVLAQEDAGFSLQLQHDHVVVMGDLNYRTITPTSDDDMEMLSLTTSGLQYVAAAAQAEKNAMRFDNPECTDYLGLKYNLLRHLSDPLYPSTDDLARFRCAIDASTPAWIAVSEFDELKKQLELGLVFHNFYEPLITFPPTYKLKLGDRGDCGDYIELGKIIDGFVVSTDDKESTDSVKGGGDADGSGSPRDNTGVIALSTVSIVTTTTSHTVEEKTKKPKKLKKCLKKCLGNVSNFLSGTSQEEADSKSFKRSLRAPSYTDRILIHSLPDYKDCMKVSSYGSCDKLRCSDHRPVVMISKLVVNSAVGNVETAMSSVINLYKLTVSDLTIHLFQNTFIDDEDGEVSKKSSKKSKPKANLSVYSIDAVQVTFPMPTKDPFLKEKKNVDIKKIINLEYKDPLIERVKEDLQLDDNVNNLLDITTVYPFRHNPVSSSQFVCTNRNSISRYGCISPLLGAHVLIKIVDKDDVCIGACNVSMNDLLYKNASHASNSGYKPNNVLTNGGKEIGSLCATFTMEFKGTVGDELLYDQS